MPGNTHKRGFASMNKKRQREIASMGGSMSPGNFKNDPQKASRAGKISRRGSSNNTQ